MTTSLLTKETATASATQPETLNPCYTIDEFAKKNAPRGWPKASTLRHLIFHKEKFGFESCIRRMGRRVLISERDFYAWVERDGGNMAKRKGGQ
jgi:hypothetical protein